jgi:hypothetical protein
MAQLPPHVFGVSLVIYMFMHELQVSPNTAQVQSDSNRGLAASCEFQHISVMQVAVVVAHLLSLSAVVAHLLSPIRCCRPINAQLPNCPPA